MDRRHDTGPKGLDDASTTIRPIYGATSSTVVHGRLIALDAATGLLL